MIRIALATAALTLMASSASAATQCHDSKTGKFVSCAPKPTTPAVTPGVTKDKSGRCHATTGKAKGRFVPCPQP